MARWPNGPKLLLEPKRRMEDSDTQLSAAKHCPGLGVSLSSQLETSCEHCSHTGRPPWRVKKNSYQGDTPRATPHIETVLNHSKSFKICQIL